MGGWGAVGGCDSVGGLDRTISPYSLEWVKYNDVDFDQCSLSLVVGAPKQGTLDEFGGEA